MLFDFSNREAGLVVGAMSRALVVPLHSRTRLVGVRFRPGHATRFLKGPVSPWTDKIIPLGEFWSDSKEIAENLVHSISPCAEAACLEKTLLRRTSSTPYGVTLKFIQAAIKIIKATRGQLAVETLAKRLGCTRQHLAREFAQAVGLSPKQFSRIVRLRCFLAKAGPNRSMAQSASEFGYADESHLDRECRLLAGTTPSQAQNFLKHGFHFSNSVAPAAVNP